MRWTLGLVCFATACFGEPAGSQITTADDTTTDSPTTPTTTESTSSEPTMSDTSESSGRPETSDSSGADTTTGDMCGMGTVPNPPPPPPGWSFVFVSTPAAEPPGCPQGNEPLAVGSLYPPTMDECECRCVEPFEELCNIGYATGTGCPVEGGEQQLDVACQPVPNNQTTFQSSGTGSTCDPVGVIPPSDLVNVCAAEQTDGPCIDQPVGLTGPCLFRQGPGECPDGLEQVDVGRVPSCGVCAPECSIGAHCFSAELEVWATDDCTGRPVELSADTCQEAADPVGSLSAHPTVPQGCGITGMTFEELTVCCPM